jgi:arsenite-transporting ATPase
MARVILVSGRGGAGKTTVAAATGLAASRRGVRTMILSFDLSRSLTGSFGIEDSLFAGPAGPRGGPVAINEHLSINEIDATKELRRVWPDGGLEGVSAEEVAMTAETAHLVTLLRLDSDLREQKHELIIVDCPSTGAALHFVNSVSAMGWHDRRRQAPEQKGRRARLMAGGLGAELGPQARDGLRAVDELLRNPEVTTLRLVTTADKVSVQETRRAYTYFSLHGITTDCVVFNRLAPEGEQTAPGQAQEPPVEKLQSLLEQLPVLKVPLHPNDVVGQKPLEAFSEQLYGREDPTRRMVSRPPLGFIKEAVDVYRLEVKLPFVEKNEIELTRRGEELAIQVGAARRNVLLPRMIALLPTLGARMEGDRLVVSFHRERSDP